MKRVHTPISAAVSISRVTGGDADFMRISIRDNNSREEFVTVEMSFEDFAMAITGVAMQPSKGDVCGLDHVGKFKETKEAEMSIPSPDRDVAKTLVETHGGEEGWLVDSYMGGRHSIRSSYSKDGVITYLAKYTLYRYVDTDPSTSP